MVTLKAALTKAEKYREKRFSVVCDGIYSVYEDSESWIFFYHKRPQYLCYLGSFACEIKKTTGRITLFDYPGMGNIDRINKAILIDINQVGEANS